ncbi:hypothetical protein VTN96DRAFT_3441 [Rasamsonia emersonii]
MSLRRTAGALKWPVLPYVRVFAPHAESTAILNARSYRPRPARSPAAGNRIVTPTTSQNLPPEVVRALGNTMKDAKRSFDRHGRMLYRSAKSSGLLPPMSFDTFRYIGNGLIQAAYNTRSTARAVRMISKDVNAVYDVAYVMGVIDVKMASWALEATREAGAVRPTLVEALRHLNAVAYPMRTPVLDRVEEWATKDEDPRAIVVHAKVLGRREQYREALALLEKLVDKTYPTRVKPNVREDVTMLGRLEAPWELYAWLKERMGDQEATDRVLKMAALEYQDPRALVEYAHLMQTQGDLEAYEEYMNKAATAGHAEACRKLANFYYLTSLGRFTTREERSEARNAFTAFFSRLFRQSRTKDDFRELAIEWYELAIVHGSDKAALVLAILMRENGESESGLEALEVAEKSKKFPKAVKRLRDNWENPDFRFPIPEQLLDL